jgi:hypothetical protein
MNPYYLFFRQNRTVVLGMFLGFIAGYIYWLHFGIYDGTSAFSSEWWTNCVYGILFGGLAGSLIKK